MNLARIERKYAHVAVTAALHDGTAATPTGVEVALLAPRTTPGSATAWTVSTYTAGDAVVLLAGPEADPTGALVVPADGADLWIRVTDNPEVTAAKVARLTVT